MLILITENIYYHHSSDFAALRCCVGRCWNENDQMEDVMCDIECDVQTCLVSVHFVPKILQLEKSHVNNTIIKSSYFLVLYKNLLKDGFD